MNILLNNFFYKKFSINEKYLISNFNLAVFEIKQTKNNIIPLNSIFY